MDTPSASPNGAANDLAERIAETCAAVAAVPDLVVACGQLLPLLAEAAGATRASLVLVNPDTGGLLIANAFGLPVDLTGKDLPYRPNSIVEWVLRNQRPLILNGEVREERFQGSDRSVDCAMSLPIEGFDGPIGVVNLARPGSGDRFDEPTMLAIARLLYPVGVAIERVHRASLADRSFRQLQRPTSAWIETHLPEGGFHSRNYEFGYTRVSSVRESGDLCVRMPHANGAQTLLAIDSSAWGPAAAITTAFTHGMFVATATPERSAVALVARLNAGLHGRLPAGGHLALWVAQLSRNGTLACCNAGTTAPIWVPADDNPPRLLTTGGPIAGAFAQADYREETLRLLPGDLIVGASNGVLLARDAAGNPFGNERLIELVSELRRGPLDRLTRAVCEAVRHYTGRPSPNDDLSVFALRYTPGD
ncbi:MAG: SpoIIE family protein phosphatase [Candidatus Eisenbacteria bacterium]|uniref:SpoIIE family protein phosphatase n=1 Tax=Eiseniibacteriota bacterium TaxID=2212470 RepID=A0A9D6QPI3_UNCEI|nr:SpoIIE family protein phosphatase [Candidatus Eisenbacteria bacterium]